MEAIIFCGIQGAGKSTYYKNHFFNSHARISLDLLKTRNRELQFLKTCIATNMRFVVDNTNPTTIDRQRYIEPALAAGYKIICYFFDVTIDLAIERNELRKGKAKIPVSGIKGTFKKLVAPDLIEGFSEVIVIK
jgi:predicted kinase